SQNPEHPHHDPVTDIVADAVGTNEAEEENQRKQDGVGHSEELRPHWNERQIQYEKHSVYDVHADDYHAKDIRHLLHQKWPSLKPVDQQGAKKNRHDPVGGNAESQKRNEAAAGGSVVRRFWSGHTLDGSSAEPLRVFGRSLFDSIRDKRGDDGA